MKRSRSFTFAVSLILSVVLLFSGVSASAALLGDATNDGKVNAADARGILRHAARLEMVTDETILPLMDVDGNGKIAAADARLALRMASRLDPTVEYAPAEKETIDFLVLVNKQNKLPDDWEQTVDLAEGTNSLGETYLVERKALSQFELLRADLLRDGIDIELDSTYRSVKRQQEIWDEFEADKGIEYAQKYVAVPGYSEHHTGLAIDVCLIKDGKVIADNDDMIAEKEIFAEIHKRLADHGFILRYPEGKENITGYSYEPWHFRYVGVDAAKEIAEKDLTLEEYLQNKATDGDMLSLWTQGAAAKTALREYLKAVTDEAGEDFIPVKDRIAVFDLDGTLFCETDPNYFDYTLLAYRVLEDPEYKDKASEFEKEVANKIVQQNETGAKFEGLEVDHGKAVASAFAGMTIAEFNAYIQEFKKQPMPSYDGMLRGDGWYLPMLQIVECLKANDFTVYVVSGTDRFIVRGIADGSPLDLPPRQIIGSDETVIARDQGDTDGLEYVFDDDDELVLGGRFIVKNLKMNKVSVIMQEIGQQPVLSFGNSTGDSSMAEFVTSNNPYRSLAFMLCCDDTVRENGSETKAQKMADLCAEFDWIPISMKNDWSTIYGDGVTKK